MFYYIDNNLVYCYIIIYILCIMWRSNIWYGCGGGFQMGWMYLRVYSVIRSDRDHSLMVLPTRFLYVFDTFYISPQ